MQRYTLLFACLLVFWTQAVRAQTETDPLLELLEQDQDTVATLLPDRMLLTHRVLWGKKGMLRVTGIAPLNEEARTRELKNGVCDVNIPPIELYADTLSAVTATVKAKLQSIAVTNTPKSVLHGLLPHPA
ncbi:hypothetical protein [Rhodoflexus sp.]